MHKTICVFGDSISWGAWDMEKGGWVNRLWLFLAEREAIRITLNRDEGLSLEYPSSSVKKDRYIMLIRRDGKSDNRYRVLHFSALEAVKYRDKEY